MRRATEPRKNYSGMELFASWLAEEAHFDAYRRIGGIAEYKKDKESADYWTKHYERLDEESGSEQS
jgi:hypothetical protein